jgi:hypothetical protein
VSIIVSIFVLTKTLTDMEDMEFLIQSQLQKKIDTFIESLNHDRVINEMIEVVTERTGVQPKRDDVELTIQGYIGFLLQDA